MPAVTDPRPVAVYPAVPVVLAIVAVALREVPGQNADTAPCTSSPDQ